MMDGVSQKKVLFVFEGGGAKGVAHVACIAGIERWLTSAGSPMKIIGVAGTSAGALVAALVAAGWRPEDLVDDGGGSPLLRRLGVSSAVRLLGLRNWGRIQAVRILSAALAHLWIIWATLAAIWLWAAFSDTPTATQKLGTAVLLTVGATFANAVVELSRFLFFRTTSTRQRRLMGLKAALAALAIAVLAAFLAQWPLESLGFGVALALVGTPLLVAKYPGGLISTKRLERWLNEALLLGLRERRGFTELPDDHRVTFADLERGGAPPLRMVATDVATGGIATFSEMRTPDVSVARAAAASAAIPVVFRPVRIRGRDYLDGGVVSNLPAWALDDIRESEPDAALMVLGIENDNLRANAAAGVWTHAVVRGMSLMGRFIWKKPRPRHPARFTVGATLRFLRSSVFGARMLEMRGIRHNALAFHSPIESIGVLDFDAHSGVIRDAKASIEGYIRDAVERRDDAERYRNAMFQRIASDFLHDFAGKLQERDAGKHAGPRVRVHIAGAQFAEDGTALLFSSAAGACADDRIILPRERSIVCEAIRMKRLRFRRFERCEDFFSGAGSPDRYRLPLLWRDLRWAIAKPLVWSATQEFDVVSDLEAIRTDPRTAETIRNDLERLFEYLERAALVIDGADNLRDSECWEKDGTLEQLEDFLQGVAAAAVQTLAFAILNDRTLAHVEERRHA